MILPPGPRISALRHIIDLLPLSVYVKDRESRFLYVNAASALSLGLTDAAQALGKTDHAFFDPKLAQHWFDLEQQMMSSGKPIIDHVAQELRTEIQNDAHWVLSCKYPFHDTHGQVAGLFGISKTFDQEHEELSRKNLAVQGAQVGLWHIKYHADGKKTAWYSPRWKQLLGYKDSEIPNSRDEFCKLLHPDDLPKVLQARNRYATNPKKEGHYECEFRMKHKTRGWIWIRSYGEAEFSPDGKTCLAFAGSHTDITAYRDEHELHEEILARLPALVFMKDEQRRFSFVNPELARYYGTTKEEMERRREHDDFYNPKQDQTQHFDRDDLAVLSDVDPSIREHGLVIDAEDIINKATGEIRQLKTIKKLFMYPSRDPKKHVLGISTDITDALKRTKDERDRQVEAHMRLRRLLGPLSSVQDLLDFRTKLPEVFKAVNAEYNCIASGVLSCARPGETAEYLMQAYATQWRSDFLNLRLARVQGNMRKGVVTILLDPLLRELTDSRPTEPVIKTLQELAGSPLEAFFRSMLVKPLLPNYRVVLAAGLSHTTGPKQLSDLISFVLLSPESENENELTIRSLRYFIQRFTESLAQFYRNSELYTERKEFLTDVTPELLT